jgi:tRNA1Val (adenine37-N6)-methyltransferase
MNDYRQPDFYRFNEDSLTLVSWLESRAPLSAHLLDLGAGSGVIGIELCNRLKCPNLTLLEAQDDFLPFLKANVEEQLKVSTNVKIIHQTFGGWKTDDQFDLIVCNPPYYLKGHGQPATDKRKNMARSFIEDDWTVLLKLVHKVMASRGKAYLVIKNDIKILSEAQKANSNLKLIMHDIGNLLILELSRLNVD